MKPLLIMVRIIFVGIFWSIFFLEGIRVILLTNWRFDIFNQHHWQILSDLWMDGWTIRHAKEWAFILIIIAFVPLWLTGWAALSLIAWDELLAKLILFPVQLARKFFYKPVKKIRKKENKNLRKKKSYKEIRPRNIRGPVEERIEDVLPRPEVLNAPKPATPAPKTTPPAPAIQALSNPAPSTPKTFDHSLFQFDDDGSDDFEFNFDAFDTTPPPPPQNTPQKLKPAREENIPPHKEKTGRDNRDRKEQSKDKKENRKNQSGNKNDGGSASHGGGTLLDIIKQKGYEVITGATFQNNLVDFVGIADKQICVCLLDKEPGDWLADEERFNDEEPLWFSESSHRISPVRRVSIACDALKEKLKEADMDYTVTPYVIIQLGNIINAEDMFEIWKEMKINVTRIDRGTPKELKLFTKTLEEADERIEKDKFEKIKKLIRNIS